MNTHPRHSLAMSAAAAAAAAAGNNDGVGKGTLTLTDSVKRELYNETPTSSKKRKTSNVDNNKDDEWVNVGTLGFYLEIKRRTGGTAPELDNDLIIQEFTSHSGKKLSVPPFDDSYNPYQIRVTIPGRSGIISIWKYSGDVFLSKFLTWSSRQTRCKASLPSNIEVLDDPKRKCWVLVPIDIHFYIHKEMNLLDKPGKNVKCQVKQLIYTT